MSHSPPRKLRKVSVRGYAGSENLWMGNTLEGIEAVVKDNEEAIELLGEQIDMLVDFDLFCINGDTVRLLRKQKDTLVALKD